MDGGAGGERRRALRVERDAGTGGAHRVPAPEPLRVPSAVPPAALPSRRDRAALRRPTVLDEAAVVAGDTMAWRSFAALDDPARRALTSPTPLTPALARSLSQHLAAPEPAAAPPVPDAPAAPQERREPSWTTGPVPARRSRRSTGPVPVPELGELPPPPPAAQVEAELRARRAAAARTSALPPAPRPVPPVSGPVSVVVPLGDLPVRTPKAAPSATAPLAPADLAALRTAAAASVTATQAPAQAPAAPAQAPTAPAAATRGRTARAGATRASAPARPTTGSTRAAGSTRPTGSTRAAGGSRPSTARRGTAARGAWYRRRALGLPAGVLAAAAGLVLAVTLGAGVVGPHKLQEVLTSAGASSPATTAPSSDASTTDAAAAVGTAGARAAGSASASATGGGAAAEPEPSGSAGQTGAPAATDASAAPSASASAPAAAASTPAATAVMPTGDVVYEGFGTAKKTYVEWGTADARDSSIDLGPTWTKAMTGSASWPGWYVGASSLDGEGTVGCRIRDAATGKVLVEQTAQGSDIAYCTLGTPAGPS